MNHVRILWHRKYVYVCECIFEEGPPIWRNIRMAEGTQRIIL